MSVRVMTAVWSVPIAPPTRKLVLLALADFASDDGGNVFPSMATLAKKTGVTRSQAQRHMRALEAAGYVSIVGNRHGGNTTPTYCLNLDRLLIHTSCIGATGSTDATGSANAQEGSRRRIGRGSTGATGGVAPVRPEPLVNRQGTVSEPSGVKETNLAMKNYGEGVSNGTVAV